MDIGELTMQERGFVAESFLFSGAPSAATEQALSSAGCSLCVFERGDNIYTPTLFLRCAGFILSGEVKATRPCVSSQSYLQNLLKAGDFFGVAALWSDDREYVTVLTASKRCRVIFFTQELLRSLMRDNFTVAENYIRFLSGRIRFLNEKIRTLTVGTAEKALAACLVSLSLQSGLRVIDCGSISALAARLNIGRASLYRAFDSLEGRSIIKRAGRTVEIADLDALSNI